MASPNWQTVRLGDIVDLNPRLDKSAYPDNLPISFVPMAGVEAETGVIDVSQTRHFADVKKGYTPFCEGDVLFAKITPCMENGKMAVVPPLKNGLGFGSTEFHVLRPSERVISQYLYFFVSASSFRREAAHHMSGAVGQRRVPTAYLAAQSIPLPPLDEQRRLVTRITSAFLELDQISDQLKEALTQIKVYRQSMLQRTFDGGFSRDACQGGR